ncbi:hypothetical protein CEP51_016923 [Fusarium floridanum]|uniref:Uncharacterized protein n=1 Tax=Fusarium floridanum TaxID=1325733 RepID=A0A428NC85_9HYPO|nr:hypothetical protein CEP51_016923 [Fusarium floridanum]
MAKLVRARPTCLQEQCQLSLQEPQDGHLLRAAQQPSDQSIQWRFWGMDELPTTGYRSRGPSPAATISVHVSGFSGATELPASFS